MKRLLASILTAIMLLSTIGTFAFDNIAFDDIDNVKNTNIWADHIKHWEELGVIEGDGCGNFEPLRYATRAEFIKMVVLAAGKSEIPGAAEPEFSDVQKSDWFYPYVKIAYQNQIIKGNEDGTLKPETEISFTEADTMCMRAFQKPSHFNILEYPRRADLAFVLSFFENSTETLLQVDCSVNSSSPEFGIYKTVGEALEAAPVVDNEDERVTISIKPGTYRERIWIDKPYITMERAEHEYGEVLLTFYYGASRSYKSFDALTPDIEYPEREDFQSDDDFNTAVKEYESQKTLLDGKPYAKSDGYISGVGTQNSASVTMTEDAHDFIAENITFENSYNIYCTDEEINDIYEPQSNTDLNLPKNLDEKKRNEAWYDSAKTRREDVTVSKDKTAQTQAVAVRCSADKSYFRNCRFIGRQDTLYIKNQARCYFMTSYIEGTVDFIFGDANALFDHCEIKSCAYPNGGYLTAGSHSENQTRGFLFFCCRLTGDEELSLLENSGKVKLGRPWKQNALVTYYKCYMGSHIATGEDRFADMSGNNKENARFMEMSSRDLDGNYFDNDVYAGYEYVEDCRYKFLSAGGYLSTPFDKENGIMGQPDGWDPTLYVLFDYFDDGEVIDGVPVWYDDNNEYFIPER